MKFACPQCQTKYSIADDKLPPAKVLKFPCKKCSHVIRLRRKGGSDEVVPDEVGGASSSAASPRPMPQVSSAAPTKVGGHSASALPEIGSGAALEGSTKVASVSELNALRAQAARPATPFDQLEPISGSSSANLESTKVATVQEINKLRSQSTAAPATATEGGDWYAMVAGVQKGPMSVDEMQAMLARREIDARTFVWKNGMANWERIETLDELKAGGAGQAKAVPAPVDMDGVATKVLPPTKAAALVADTVLGDDLELTPGHPQPSLKQLELQRRPTESFNEPTAAMSTLALQKKLVEMQITSPLPPPVSLATAVPAAPLPTPEPQDDFYKASTVVTSEPEVLAALQRARAQLAGGASEPTPVPQADVPTTAAPESPLRLDRDDIAQRITAELEPFDLEAEPEEDVASLDVSATEEPVALPLSALDDAFPPAPTAQPSFAAEPTPFANPANTEPFVTPEGQADASYVNAPPGESTRVFMQTAGIYKRRRVNKVAAVIGSAVAVVFAGVVALDLAGVIEIPAMGAVYEMTGVADPNVNRALERTERKLASQALDPTKRASLEALRRKLLGVTDPATQQKRKKVDVPAPQAQPEKDVVQEGVKDPGKLTDTQAQQAQDVFSDARKSQGDVGLKLQDPEAIQTPNLPAGLTQEAIFKVIQDNNGSMKLCFAEASRKGEKLTGKMEIEMTIDASGTVTDAKIMTDQFKNSVMGECTLKRVKSWKFPRFNGTPVTVAFPYVLQMGM